MKYSFLAFFLCFYFTFYGQDSTLDSIPSIDSLVEKGNPDPESKTDDKKESLFNYLSKKELLEITLTADFDTLIENKKKITKFIPAKVSFLNHNNEMDTLKASIRPRGKFRRKVCAFPPLRLKFKKKGLKKLGLNDNFSSFKIVTHCINDKKDSENNIFKEYLLYKIYNLHTDHSFRAQLIKVSYVQKGSGKKLFDRFGILLEDDDEVADRTNATIVDRFAITSDSLTTFSCTVHSIFQCMIGNADWSTMGMRNVKLMKVEDQDRFTILPYDFDCSGFVSASYAIPNPDYNLISVRQRVFLGKIYSDEEMAQIMNHFLERKTATLDLVKNFSFLRKRCKKETVKYLNSFYKKMNDEKKFINELRRLSPKKS